MGTNALARLAPYLIGAACFLAFIAGVWLYGQSQYRAGKQHCQDAQVLAELKEFQRMSKELSGLSQMLETATTNLANAKPKTIERYTRVEVQSPLPAGCVRDPERVRATNEAITEANAARQLGGAVSRGVDH